MVDYLIKQDILMLLVEFIVGDNVNGVGWNAQGSLVKELIEQ